MSALRHERDIAHEWVGCKCSRCETIRSRGHQWAPTFWGRLRSSQEIIINNGHQWEKLDAFFRMGSWETTHDEVIQCWRCYRCGKTRVKATVSSKVETLDSGKGFIFAATPDGTTCNVWCIAAYYGDNCPRMKGNLNIGAKIALMGVWEGSRFDRFNIEHFCDVQNWEPY